MKSGRQERRLDFGRFQIHIMVTTDQEAPKIVPALWLQIEYQGKKKVYYTETTYRYTMFAPDHGKTYHPLRLNGTRSILPFEMMSQYFKLDEADMTRFRDAFHEMASLHAKVNHGL